MESLKPLENKLAGLFKDAPALPKNAKEAIVKYWPYVVLVGGILQLLAAWALWDLISKYDKVADTVNSFTLYYTGTTAGLSSGEKFVIYVGVVVLLVEAILLLMAFSPLTKRQRRGWQLLFLVALLQVVYSVISVFVVSYGAGNLIFNLLFAAIGFYFLFQIREYYTDKAPAKAK